MSTETSPDAPPAPDAIAIVGASDNTPWTYWLHRNLRDHGFTGEIWPVNPRQPEVVGLPTFDKIAALPGVPGLAVCVVSPQRAEEAVAELVELGTREIVLVSNGFRETGRPEDIAREDRMVASCREAGVRLVGPNGVGFADLARSLCAVAEPMPRVTPGSTSVISQSGALLSAVLGAIDAEGLGIDTAYSIGNGGEFPVEAALEQVAARSTTNAIVVVLEGVREPDRFAAAVETAQARDVDVVVVRLGRSAASQEVAQSHTGAVVGADRLVGAWLDGLGVIQVDDVRQAAAVVALRSRLGRPAPGAGLFVITGSGGGAQVAADAAARHGVQMAELGNAARAVLEEKLPGMRIGNPLDLAGAGDADARRAIYRAIYEDPAVAAVLEPYALQWPDEGEGRAWYQNTLLRLEEASENHGTPTLTASIQGEPLTSWVTQLRDRGHVFATSDLDALLGGLAHVLPAESSSTDGPKTSGAVRSDVLGEAEAREVLEVLGVPLVSSRTVPDADAARQAAEEMSAPFVVKASVAGLGHKAKIGGVRLGLSNPHSVVEACAAISDAASSHGIDELGFLVQEMVFGPEVLVGMLRDPVAGPVLNVGIGGWAAELGAPALTLALPAPPGGCAAALGASPLARVLGSQLDALASVVELLATEFASGRLREFSEVECNPVVLTADGPRVVDAMAVRENREESS